MTVFWGLASEWTPLGTQLSVFVGKSRTRAEEAHTAGA